jgi:hypothetical protein
MKNTIDGIKNLKWNAIVQEVSSTASAKPYITVRKNVGSDVVLTRKNVKETKPVI